MKRKYWRVVCRYGHVGIGKEVSVARHIETSFEANCIDVYKLAATMPGVKSRGVMSVEPITLAAYSTGKESERSNFYLERLLGTGMKHLVAPAHSVTNMFLEQNLRDNYGRGDCCVS